MNTDGEPLCTVSIKDGYALCLAAKHKTPLTIITGGHTEAVRRCFLALGILAGSTYMGSPVKIHNHRDFCDRYGLQDEEVLYVGGDTSDIEVMSTRGLPCCPNDATPGVESVAYYIFYRAGGYGCGCDVIEQFLGAKGLWMINEKVFGW